MLYAVVCMRTNKQWFKGQIVSLMWPTLERAEKNRKSLEDDHSDYILATQSFGDDEDILADETGCKKVPTSDKIVKASFLSDEDNIYEDAYNGVRYYRAIKIISVFKHWRFASREEALKHAAFNYKAITTMQGQKKVDYINSHCVSGIEFDIKEIREAADKLTRQNYKEPF